VIFGRNVANKLGNHQVEAAVLSRLT